MNIPGVGEATEQNAGCDHRYVFVRQEKESDGGHFRPTYSVFDLFFCEKCLQYQKKKVAEEVANGFDSGYTRRSVL